MSELVNVDDPGAGQDVLDADPSENPCQVADHVELPRRPRAEVGVPALGCPRHKPAVDIEEDRLTEPRARGHDRRIPSLGGMTGVQLRKLVRLEDGDAVRERFEVVQHPHALEPERRGDGRPIDPPRHVGEVCDLVGHRSGHAEARRVDGTRLDALRFEERPHDWFQPRKVERDELGDVYGRRPLRSGREEAEQCLRTADVACKEHGRIIHSIRRLDIRRPFAHLRDQ
jgi:hypothetical protein